MNLEQTFLQFLKDWLAWAEAGAPEHKTFGCTGLCRASYRYAVHNLAWKSADISPLERQLDKELEKDFDEDSEDPFGWYECNVKVPSHKWEPRLTWVRNKIKELEQCA